MAIISAVTGLPLNAMTDDILRYEKIVEDALRGVVRTALDQVGAFGLPDGHALYIGYLTRFAGVGMPKHLLEKYPNDITIVLEHQFWDLRTFDDHFEVTLSFDRKQERLSVPWSAIISFADPSAQFGLKFEATKAPETISPGDGPAPSADNETGPKTGEVVNLDAFRKR